MNAIIEMRNGELAGFVTFEPKIIDPKYALPEDEGKKNGYVQEAVVHKDLAGHGIGTQL